MNAKIGSTVKCVDAPDYLRSAVALDGEYVVNGRMTMSNNGAVYYKVLGEDDRGHWLLSDLFTTNGEASSHD